MYDDFSSKIEECRRMRNVIVHGNWEWRGFLDSLILYHAPEPFNQQGSLKVREFQEQLCFLEKTMELFSNLRPVIERGLLNNSQQSN